MIGAPTLELDYERMRTAGKDLLSLAFIDSRNRSLRWAGALAETLGRDALRWLADDAPRHELEPPLWSIGHLGWFQEYWIARNVQRRRGEAAKPRQPRLASILPEADRWFDPAASTREARWSSAAELPDLPMLRSYLVDTLETTLELLDAEPSEDDPSLFFYRLAVLHEDMAAESFAVLAQTIGVAPGPGPMPALREPPALAQAPLFFPATRWQLGFSGPGFAFDHERAAHQVLLPEFEIDAQAVSWAQYGEFVEDGGYDDPAHWSAAGQAWLSRTGRRTPRHVEQMRHGVLQRRFGQLTRLPAGAAATHLSHHEAEAWCRWAGRRLPAEVEWEAAAHLGAKRGFRAGAVHEWTATTFAPYPGYVPGPWADASAPFFGTTKVLRGASPATPLRLSGAKLRRFALPDDDAGFFGFRSCAV